MEPETEVVFISVFNLGAIELAKNHLESLKRQNIDNYVAYVLDEESFDILQEEGYHVVWFKPENSTELSKEKEDFGTKLFNEFSYVRYLIIQQLLKEGKAVWYMDVDTVVLSDLNLVYNFYATNLKKYDIILQDDINMACTGCMLCFPTEKTMDMLETTYSRRNDEFNDQILLNTIVQEKYALTSSSEYESQEKIAILLLSRMEFPNGLLVFHPKHPNAQYAKLQEDFRSYRSGGGRVYFVHANWMVGIDTKISALKTLGAWFL